MRHRRHARQPGTAPHQGSDFVLTSNQEALLFAFSLLTVGKILRVRRVPGTSKQQELESPLHCRDRPDRQTDEAFRLALTVPRQSKTIITLAVHLRNVFRRFRGQILRLQRAMAPGPVQILCEPRLMDLICYVSRIFRRESRNQTGIRNSSK